MVWQSGKVACDGARGLAVAGLSWEVMGEWGRVLGSGGKAGEEGEVVLQAVAGKTGVNSVSLNRGREDDGTV
nr:hypothetical protein [Tanacetum cinerariifolium]